ncbi:MATE family efflux transporter [Lactobacillus mulieris]|uniref:Heteropolysaccharide repeat unit export protein n=1 Tax=Lactobacillus mulieris TaxID=2508708 RepID=A0AAW5WZC1_9LACO|nr:hypothetical protein [Lactobacillus mulieris]MCZ3622327.1 hypothetical protein [Lactobacillus mulieris]MCZ3622973.1 hypothetical protein [Lactobacillus mulieris]MCZ3636334.1 hypothetical protein [Lactobacillus mulieris]MCZ3690702.1 hypothetical protein [Lactobacillus mulieris]MCZ3696660.1 hypothetical protein [Lactobacillus mulieris]
MDKNIKKNFLFAFIAQAISLIVSSVTNLVLPKFLSVSAFSYWQLFIFYSTYIPCLALGLNDGIYLRYGGYHIKKLDFSEVKSQFFFGQVFQIVLGLLVGLIAFFCSTTLERKIIWVLVIIYFFIFTAHNFLGYIFQAVNETNLYSKSIIYQRLVFFLFQLVSILLFIRNVYFYISFYVLGVLVALIYLTFKIYRYFKQAKLNWKLGTEESFISMKVGISLMISNICSMLILGVSRQIIDLRWGLISFGKVSFSLSLMNFALTFVMQIGLVLFPALRRLTQKDLKQYYKNFTIKLFEILPLMYLCYLPLQYILKAWLPEYAVSIDYLAVVLPICYFDCKMELIGNTFYKVLNKQVMLLRINIITIILSAFLGLISAYVLNNMNLIIVSMVISIIFRSLLANYILKQEIKFSVLKYDLFDVILALIFVLVSHYFIWWLAFISIIAVYAIRILFVKIQE